MQVCGGPRAYHKYKLSINNNFCAHFRLTSFWNALKWSLGYQWSNCVVQVVTASSGRGKGFPCYSICPWFLDPAQGFWSLSRRLACPLEGSSPRVGLGFLLGPSLAPNHTGPVNSHFLCQTPPPPGPAHSLQVTSQKQNRQVCLMWLFVFHFLCWLKNVASETFYKIFYTVHTFWTFCSY